MYLNKGFGLLKGAITGSWSLTWDVFKSQTENRIDFGSASWSLTWDVFKWTIYQYGR